MSEGQKVIKYVAIAFAIYLIVNILAGLIGLFGGLLFFFDDDDNHEMKGYKIENNVVIDKIDISVNEASLEIVNGEEFLVETDNENIKIKEDKGQVSIKEDKFNWFKKNHHKVVITIPEELSLREFELDAGAGQVQIDKLETRKLELEVGAGKLDINKLTVLDEAKIEGGAGDFDIQDGVINNLEFEMGAGKGSFTGSLLGRNKIEAGVGKLDITLKGVEDDYKLSVEKGIGKISLNGEELSRGTRGNGSNIIAIEGGVGEIKINFTNEEVNKNLPNVDEKPSEPNQKEEQNDGITKDDIIKTKQFTKTYTVLNVTEGQEENMYYLTLQMFQGEVDTVLVKLDKKLNSGKAYEFTFEIDNNEKIQDNIKEIFTKSKIIAINETAKVGLNQRQDSI